MFSVDKVNHEDFRNNKTPSKKLLYLYRQQGVHIRTSLPELIELKQVPRVFLHGNPHLENYRQTVGGVGLLDFDRARIGPYLWDIIRFLGSLVIYKKEDGTPFLSKNILELFSHGYQRSLIDPDINHTIPSLFTKRIPKNSKTLTLNYGDARYKWLKKIQNNLLDGKQKKEALKMFSLFLENRSEQFLLEQFSVHTVGESVGSFGKKHTLFWLKDQKKERQALLIDLKETYSEADDDWFSSPTPHSGQRMVKAGELYGNSLEQRTGFFTYKDQQYWGREIPPYSLKVSFDLSAAHQEDIAYAVGSQLGRGHALSVENPYEKSDIVKHWLHNKNEIFTVTKTIHQKLLKLYKKIDQIEDNQKA